MSWKKVFSVLFTLLVFGAAVVVVRLMWIHYMDSPWTRDGRVRADIINIAPDVSGLIVEILVRDNQRVKKSDLLMRIDPEHYRHALDEAEAEVASRKAELVMREDDAKRRLDMDALVVSRESRENAHHIVDSARAAYQNALSRVEEARLNLHRTEVRASVDGYITNLQTFEGDFAQRGKPVMALVDSHSFYVYGYFEETRLPWIREGDKADLRLMSGEELTGTVDSIARGIYDRNNPESQDLVANVNPTFNWVRLAQRIPVRIHLDPPPARVLLSAGQTCTVTIHTTVDPATVPSPDRI